MAAVVSPMLTARHDRAADAALTPRARAQYGGPPGNLTINTNNTAQQSAATLGNGGSILQPNGNYPWSTFGFNQFNWFLADIGAVDRARTPWVIVAWHQPAYNSYQTHYKEFECGRQQIEPYLYANGVDLVMHGHIHAYERTYPVNNYSVDQCGMRWITIGDGGNVEGLYKTYAAQNGTCFCTPINNSTYSNGCPCANVLPSAVPQARGPCCPAPCAPRMAAQPAQVPERPAGHWLPLFCTCMLGAPSCVHLSARELSRWTSLPSASATPIRMR